MLTLPTKKVTATLIDNAAAGRSLRRLRESKGISIRSLAKLMNISPMFLSDLERGRRNWTSERFKQAQGLLK